MKNWLAWGLVCAVVMGGLLTAPTLAQFNQQLLTRITAAGPACSATTWNSADKDASITLSTDQCTATASVTGAFRGVRSTTSKPAGAPGKYYFEITFGTTGTSTGGFATNNYSNGGIGNSSVPLTSFPGSATNGAGLAPSWDISPWNQWYYNNTGLSNVANCIKGGVGPNILPVTIGYWVDLGSGGATNLEINCTLDGVNWGATALSFTGIGAGPYYIMWSGGVYPTSPGTNAAWAKINTSAPFTISAMPPSGFPAWQ
jgi:hypothetical protein